MNSKIIIVKANEEGGYYLDGHFVLVQNWQISKLKFSPAAQADFEEKIINKK